LNLAPQLTAPFPSPASPYTQTPTGIPQFTATGGQGPELMWPNGARRRLSSPAVAEAKRALIRIDKFNAERRYLMDSWTAAQLENRREVELRAKRALAKAVRECLGEWGVVPARRGGYVVDAERWAA
jgi:hypothetical protein